MKWSHNGLPFQLNRLIADIPEMLMDLCYTVMAELIIWSSVYSHSSEMEKKHNNKKKNMAAAAVWRT